MSNTYFQFKQFTVQQDRCAMKVCTDACLFGSWVASKLNDAEIPGSGVLDIGAGTGLLSLMVAQQLPVDVSAVELNEASFIQATENVSNSKWADKIKVIHADILQFRTLEKFGLIISNPPFFQNDLKSDKPERNMARHEQLLNLSGLFSCVGDLLLTGGYFTLLLPAQRIEQAVQTAAASGMHVRCKALVRQTPLHEPFRVMFIFSATAGEIENEEIIIKTGDSYSDRFTELLQPFYLYL